MTYDPDDPKTWHGFKPTIIAHDVARSRDRSTAVVGGFSPFHPHLLGIDHLEELPQGLCGSDRANALAEVDRRYLNNALIVADLSNDPSYAEVLAHTFGPRVVGVQITRNGDGSTFERRPTPHGVIPVYTIGRTNLIEGFLAELERDDVRPVKDAMWRMAYQQLADLEVEDKEYARIYKCVSGRHDDLGISCAMLVWAARHPHLSAWVQISERPRILRKPRPAPSPRAWT